MHNEYSVHHLTIISARLRRSLLGYDWHIGYCAATYAYITVYARNDSLQVSSIIFCCS